MADRPASNKGVNLRAMARIFRNGKTTGRKAKPKGRKINVAKAKAAMPKRRAKRA